MRKKGFTFRERFLGRLTEYDQYGDPRRRDVWMQIDGPQRRVNPGKADGAEDHDEKRMGLEEIPRPSTCRRGFRGGFHCLRFGQVGKASFQTASVRRRQRAVVERHDAIMEPFSAEETSIWAGTLPWPSDLSP